MIGRTNVAVGGSGGSSGGGSGSGTAVALINVTTPSVEFYGKLVSCAYESETGSKALVESFSDDGKCTFSVPLLTTYTISCGDVSTTVEVTEEGTVLSTELVLPKAVLNLTTSNLNGEIVTVSIGETTYTGTFVDGACTITVYVFGTATITCSETTVEQVVENGGEYTVDVTEFVRVDYISGTSYLNGAKEDLGQYITASTQAVDGVTYNKYQNTGTTQYTRTIIKIPASKSLVGHTLHIKGTRNTIGDIHKFQYVYGSGSTDYANFSSIGSGTSYSVKIPLEESYFDTDVDGYHRIRFCFFKNDYVIIKEMYVE